jgi:hypothetical protein
MRLFTGIPATGEVGQEGELVQGGPYNAVVLFPIEQLIVAAAPLWGLGEVEVAAIYVGQAEVGAVHGRLLLGAARLLG